MVVNGDREFLLRLILADYVAIQKRLDLRRPRQSAIGRTGLLALLVFENLLADAHALVANVRARIFRRRTDKFLHLLLSLMAERTSQRLFWSKPFHRASPLSSENITSAPTPKQYLIVKRKIAAGQSFITFTTNLLELYRCLEMISSTMPYALDCSAVMMKSRSTSRSIFSR